MNLSKEMKDLLQDSDDQFEMYFKKPEDLEKIFDQFYRSKSIQNPKIKGTGLGLSIVKRICFMLDVALKIKSEENIGTVVSFTFQKQVVSF